MIIDASVGVKWILPEEDSAKALDLFQQSELIVPGLFHVEIGNALWRKAQNGEVELTTLLPFLGGVPELVTTLSEVDYVPRAAEIAVELGHPIYDCIYLAMAGDLEMELKTADLKFLAKVSASPYARQVSQL